MIFFVAIVMLISTCLMAVAGQGGRLHDYYLDNEERMMATSHQGTVFIITAQIAVNAQSAHVFRGGSPFVAPFGFLLKLYEIFTLVSAHSNLSHLTHA